MGRVKEATVSSLEGRARLVKRRLVKPMFVSSNLTAFAN